MRTIKILAAWDILLSAEYVWNISRDIKW